jgi:hypothetical protein
MPWHRSQPWVWQQVMLSDYWAILIWIYLAMQYGQVSYLALVL